MPDLVVVMAALALLPITLLVAFAGCSAIVDPSASILAEIPITVVFDPAGGVAPFSVEIDVDPVSHWGRGSLPDPEHIQTSERAERLADGRDRYELRVVLRDQTLYGITCRVFDDRPVPDPFIPAASCSFQVAIGPDGLPLPVSFETMLGARSFRISGCEPMG
jgi:hypothetical protein